MPLSLKGYLKINKVGAWRQSSYSLGHREFELIIAEGRDGEIAEALAEGTGIYKTQTFDQHLFELIVNGVVDEEIGLEKATSPSDLKLRLQNINFADSRGGENQISLKQNEE